MWTVLFLTFNGRNFPAGRGISTERGSIEYNSIHRVISDDNAIRELEGVVTQTKVDLVMLLGQPASLRMKLFAKLEEHGFTTSNANLCLFENPKENLNAQIVEARLLRALAKVYGFVVGYSEATHKACKIIDLVSDSGVTVLIVGETGTGKELIARAIHSRGNRKNGPFVSINVAAVPSELIESTLFGYQRGAFTGATQNVAGLFERAHRGTLLLDEVADLSLAMQAKLLRVLETFEFTRLGANKSVNVDVRVLAATNRDLHTLTSQGRFREDLFFRLAVVIISLPPLRKRLSDIPLLVNWFLEDFVGYDDARKFTFSPEAMGILAEYQWPGNIRELRSFVQRSALLAPDKVISAAFCRELLLKFSHAEPPNDNLLNLPLKDAETAFLRKYVLHYLSESSGNVGEAARRMGIHRNSLSRLLKRLELQKRGNRD